MFKNYINIQKQNIINSICDLITYPSISVESNIPNAPFGKDCANSLKYFLRLANSLGFRTKNVDGYCGWAEFGSGDTLIGIIGHLDVVPAIEEDWKYSPFTATIYKNRIYGRGAIDDKGPVIASLYAMKSVMDYYKDNNLKLNKRVRLIVGLNEEKDWKCINYYKEHEEIPSVGFSPDSDFPCIYAEKSVLSLLIKDTILPYTPSLPLSKFIHKTPLIQIKEIDCANNAINVVPKFCSVLLQIAKSLNIQDIINYLKQRIDFYNYEIDLYKLDEHSLKLTSHGKSAHSAHPDLGINAISKLLTLLNDLFIKYNINFPLINNYCKFIGDDYLGTRLGINVNDESGYLTLNTSQFFIKDNQINIGINLRIPVTFNINTIISKFEHVFSKKCIHVIGKNDALFIEKNNKLVTELCSIFNDTCGTAFEPIAIGGATYARAFPNFISFGMNFPGDKDMCHQVDEFVDIDKLILSTNIYAKSVYSLLNNF